MRIDDRSLAELRDQAETTVAVAAAYAAGVFRALGEGAASAEEVAGRAHLDRRAVAILLPALAEAGLLEREDDRYRPTAACRRGLCDPDSADFVGGGLPHWLHNLQGWTRLDMVLRTGEPLRSTRRQRTREDRARFMAAMAAAPAERLRKLVDVCLARVPGARTALDVGGGPGRMARELVERGLEVTLFDTPPTVEFVADEYGLAEVKHLRLVGGDFTVDPLPDGPFDIVLLSNVLHIYGPETNRRLLEEVARVSAPGGVVAVQDFVRGRSSRAARFALVMLMRTDGGNTYGEDEIGGWMEGAGLVDVRLEDLDPDRQLVTARKPHGSAPAGS